MTHLIWDELVENYAFFLIGLSWTIYLCIARLGNKYRIFGCVESDRFFFDADCQVWDPPCSAACLMRRD